MNGRQGDPRFYERGQQGGRNRGRSRPQPQWENDEFDRTGGRGQSGYGREYDDFGSRASRGWSQVGERRGYGGGRPSEPGEFGDFGEPGEFGDVDPGGYSGYGYRSDQRSASEVERENDPRRRFGVGGPRRVAGSFGEGEYRQGGYASETTGATPSRGSYAGRGPKGYRRSDERVLEEVNQTLEDHPEIDASNIEVSCRNGEIVLQGTVEDRRTKRLAESCIEELPGVKDVRNELRVQAGSMSGGNEGE